MRRAVLVVLACMMWACGGGDDTSQNPAVRRMQDEITAARDAMATQPNSPMLFYQIGQIYERYGMPDSALAAYDHSVQLHEAFPEAHLRRGDLHFQRQELEQAVEAYEQASRYAPEDAQIHNNLGFIYRRLGRLDAAIAAYRQALRVDSVFVEAINNLGQVYREVGDTTGAIIVFRHAIDVDTDFRPSYVNLAKTLSESGQSDSERVLLELMVARFGASSDEGSFAANRLRELAGEEQVQ